MKQMLKMCVKCLRDVPVLPGYYTILCSHVCVNGKSEDVGMHLDLDERELNLYRLLTDIESWEISTEIPEWFKERVSDVRLRIINEY